MFIIDCFFGAGDGDGDDGCVFFAGAVEGIETGFLGSFIPPVLEFLSALFLVFMSFGFSSLSTRTNSISFTFGFGLSKRCNVIPKNASIATNAHNENIVTK